MTWRFPVRYFLKLFWENRCIFLLSGFLRALLILLSNCLSIQPFRYIFLLAIFYPQIVRFLLHPVVGMFLCHLLPAVDRIFSHCFGMSCFICIVLPFVDISLIFLFSGLFPQAVLLFYLVLPFSFLFQRIPASFLCFIIMACFRRFLCAFPVEFSILVLIFSFVIFEGIPIFSQTNFIPAYISLFNLVILFDDIYGSTWFIFSFPSWLFFILCILVMLK